MIEKSTGIIQPLGEQQRSRKVVFYQRVEFVKRIEEALDTGRKTFEKAQARLKRYFDLRTRQANQDIASGDFFYIDPESGGGKKLRNHAIGPYLVLDRDQRTFMIQEK